MFPIAWITLRRITEKSILAQFGILALVLVYIGLGMDKIILTDAADAEQGGLGVGALFITAFTVFWSTIEIPREIDRKEVHVYLAKPMSRFKYLLGKYLGMTAMVLAVEGVLMLIFAGCLRIQGQHLTSGFLSGVLRLAMFLVLLNAICLMISMRLSEVQAMVAVLVVLGLMGLVCALAVLSWAAYDPLPHIGLASAYHLLPDLLHYRWEPASSQLPGYIAALALYTAGWSTLCLLIARRLFERIDLP